MRQPGADTSVPAKRFDKNCVCKVLLGGEMSPPADTRVDWEGSLVLSSPQVPRKAAETATTGRIASVEHPHLRVLDHSDSTVLIEAQPVWRGAGHPRHRPFKHVFDVLGALLLGLAFLPLILVVAVVLRREGGPVFFHHRRIGRDGVIFECLKFRTMVPDADRVLREMLERSPEIKAEWLRNHKLKIDPRITPVGRFLRRTSLDELPQLWNVICGDMSLVGPRPVVLDELIRYGRFAPKYLSVRPGLTGLWQVNGRNNTSYRRRVALDVYYVRRQNIWLDLQILARTVKVVFGDRGAY